MTSTGSLPSAPKDASPATTATVIILIRWFRKAKVSLQDVKHDDVRTELIGYCPQLQYNVGFFDDALKSITCSNTRTYYLIYMSVVGWGLQMASSLDCAVCTACGTQFLNTSGTYAKSCRICDVRKPSCCSMPKPVPNPTFIYPIIRAPLS